jgi:hypothetical protein
VDPPAAQHDVVARVSPTQDNLIAGGRQGIVDQAAGDVNPVVVVVNVGPGLPKDFAALRRHDFNAGPFQYLQRGLVDTLYIVIPKWLIPAPS